ncbi:MAG: hypothetical protein JO089_08010 [Alphaproteobacteria bacterium]|nr:hypothetical protein [Alphaproteobacteria bacterium]
MSKSRLPKNYQSSGDDTPGNVTPFATRLTRLQQSLVDASTPRNIAFSQPEAGFEEVGDIAAEYALLASFTGMLASLAIKLDAEVAETGAAFRRSAPLNPILRTQLRGGMDEILIDEIRDHHPRDGDQADLANQIRSFVAEMRRHYNLEPRQR